MSTAVTILDIAREAGVSPSTVSRVLNGNAPVAADKRAAVLSVVEKLRYRPNAFAQGLVRGRAAAVGVLTQSIASPFYGEILLGVERGLAGSGYHPIFASGNWQTEDELAALDLLSARRVDALIVLVGVLSDEYLRRAAADLPLVVVGRSIAGLEECCLRVDDQRASYEATRYLVGLGHRRIAHIAGPSHHQDAVDRREGYLQALADAGLPADPGLIVEGNYTEQSGLLAMQALLSRAEMFSAVFAGNDQMALGVLRALHELGRRVPEQVAVMGYDDQEIARHTDPPLSTLELPNYEMGRLAVETLLAELAHLGARKRSIKVEGQLIRRATT